MSTEGDKLEKHQQTPCHAQSNGGYQRGEKTYAKQDAPIQDGGSFVKGQQAAPRTHWQGSRGCSSLFRSPGPLWASADAAEVRPSVSQRSARRRVGIGGREFRLLKS